MKPLLKKRVGLTGGIGTGKSKVAQLLLKMGIPCLDADQVSRDLRSQNGAAAPLILNRFGTLDRLELKTLIASDPSAKKDLEAILHPLIKSESDQRLNQLANQHPDAKFVLYEAALLIEAGRAADFDELILVTAPIHDRITRIVKRDAIAHELAQKIINAQLTDAERIAQIPASIPTWIIENHGTEAELIEKVRKILDPTATK
jgi:dephospho-CoA kinase